MENAPHMQLISKRYRGLLRAGRPLLTAADMALVRRALGQVVQLYQGSTLPSGEPYPLRPLDVARVCVEEIGLGGLTLPAVILQDTVADGHLTIAQIQAAYGAPVAQMVDGLTRISAISPRDPKAQAEHFRELILTLAQDARVILVKLAERLHHMRALAAAPRDEQLRSSWEAFYLYAPMAHRLGLYRLKSEMEDIALMHTNPQGYEHIQRKLRNTSARRNRFIREFMAPIRCELQQRGFDFEIKGRPKSVYSIWRKMTSKGIDFEDIYDVFAIRVVLNSPPEREKSDCWQVYSIVTDRWTPNPERMRDWISVPKTNGYESLHTTVVGPEGRWVEVQIRTRRMDEIAEKGLAAHWKYKGLPQESGIDGWLAQIREMMELAEPTPDDLVDQLQLSLYSDEVFVFTPNGDLKKLPQGASVLDFAFAVHTTLGKQCVGARVNGRNVPIKHLLRNGDVVSITTSKQQKPKPDWLTFVATGKARAKIKQILREEKSKEITIAREALYRRLKNWKVAEPDEAVRLLQRRFKCRTAPELFEAIAGQRISLAQIKEFLEQPEGGAPEAAARPEAPEPKPPAGPSAPYSSEDYLVIDDKLLNVDYRLSKCCKPIFGDEIFGFITIASGIKIHRVNCPNAVQLVGRYPYRLVKARWRESSRSGSFQTSIRVVGMDQLGIAGRITEVIGKDLQVSMRSFTLTTTGGMFEGTIQVHVSDTKHLEMLLYRLARVKGVTRAVRLQGE